MSGHMAPWADPHWSLAVDLYEISMVAGYWHGGMTFPATFELTFRHMPPNRGYLIACGIETALRYIQSLRFDETAIGYLRTVPAFAHLPEAFWDYLRAFRFTGTVWAVPEGTIVFAHEPVIVVHAPLPEAQILETFLLSVVNFQTMVATKAARIVEAARGRGVVEFGLRRAHSPEAGFWAARAAYVGGCIGTSNLQAGYAFHIPVYGTMAHSWVLAHRDEVDAFRHFHALFPENTILLVDTFDPLEGVRNAIAAGVPMRAIRLDSGDLAELTRQARQLLDAAGRSEVKIILSGDLNEYIIDALLQAGVPVDLFGVGTELVTSRDAPAMTGVYKLVAWEKDGTPIPRMKTSPGKLTLPGRKQIYRFQDDRGMYHHDVLALADESVPGGQPLLRTYIEQGQWVASFRPLPEVQQYVREQLNRLPAAVRRLRNPASYSVEWSAGVQDLVHQLTADRKAPKRDEK